MAKAKTTGAAQAETLAGEAWAAGCRDVQSAINWASGKGGGVGTPFQAAFRKVMAASPAVPAAAPAVPKAADPSPVPAALPSKPSRKTRPAPEKGGSEAEVLANEGITRTRPEGDVTPTGKLAPAKASGVSAEPKTGTPAEFVEDMRQLRQMVTKYGKKGLADLIGILGG